MSVSYIRAFFALDLPLACKQSLDTAMDALRLYLKKEIKRQPFRWVKPRNLHLTLQFLGRVNEDELEKLKRQVQAEIKGLKSFYLSLGPLEWFPSSYRPSVLSLRAEPHEALAALALAIGKGAAALGYAIEERPFRGHLTLARAEGLHNVDPALLSSFSWPPLPEIFVNEIVLFKSEPQSGGSVYTQLASLALES